MVGRDDLLLKMLEQLRDDFQAERETSRQSRAKLHERVDGMAEDIGAIRGDIRLLGQADGQARGELQALARKVDQNQKETQPTIDEWKRIRALGIGIAGLLGSGRTELLQAIMGVRAADHGEIHADGKPVTGARYRHMVERGFGYTPESRKEEGIVPLLGVDENTLVTDLAAVSRRGVLSAGLMAAATRRIVEHLHIKTARTDTPIGTLSGGNQQKVVIGRWVHARSRVLLLDEPTRGVDVEAKSQIYAIIRQLAAEGCGIVFVSSEIEELPLVCDRVLVLREGRLAEEFTAPEIDQDAVMAACLTGH